VWLDLREEIAGEFESLEGHDRLDAAIERAIAWKLEQARLRERERWQRMTPEQRHAHSRKRWQSMTAEQRQAHRVRMLKIYHAKKARSGYQPLAKCPWCNDSFARRCSHQVYCSPRCKEIKGYVARWGRVPVQRRRRRAA